MWRGQETLGFQKWNVVLVLITVLKGIKFPPHKDHLNPQTTALRAATGRAGHKSGCVGRAMGSLQKSAKSERHVQLGFGWSHCSTSR